MEDSQFWAIVTPSSPGLSLEETVAEMENKLRELTPEEIVIFDRIYSKKMRQSYTWKLWGAADVIAGGCSDDGFTVFRNWLISRGEEVYNSALENPDSLAEYQFFPESDGEVYPFLEYYDELASEVYKKKTGISLVFQSYILDEPEGEEYEEEDLLRLYPQLTRKFS